MSTFSDPTALQYCTMQLSKCNDDLSFYTIAFCVVLVLAVFFPMVSGLYCMKVSLENRLVDREAVDMIRRGAFSTRTHGTEVVEISSLE